MQTDQFTSLLYITILFFTGIIILLIYIIKKNKKTELIKLVDDIFDNLCNQKIKYTTYFIGHKESLCVNRALLLPQKEFTYKNQQIGNYQISMSYTKKTDNQYEANVAVWNWNHKKRLYSKMGIILHP
ncbi:MAG: hypothetical protein NT085_05175 [candidate division SR1 bacterium]|nr:hypothetical protein [candidate division SR1 bacterium]